ncbi:MAG: HAMP domain-containing protein [Nitrospirota bacterium]
MQNDWRRRNYFVKKGFQSRFVARFLIVAVAGFAAAGYLVYRSAGKSAEELFYSNHFRLKSTSDLVIPALLKVNLLVALLILAAVSIVVLVISHRLAGPIFRLGKSAERIGNGDLTGSFDLRARDEIKSLSESFKQMNGSLREQFADMKREASAIESYSKKMLEGDCITREEAEDFYRLSSVFGKKLEKFIVR